MEKDIKKISSKDLLQELIKRKDNEIKELRKTIELQNKALSMDKKLLPTPIIITLVIATLIIGACLGLTISSEVLGGLL